MLRLCLNISYPKFLRSPIVAWAFVHSFILYLFNQVGYMKKNERLRSTLSGTLIMTNHGTKNSIHSCLSSNTSSVISLNYLPLKGSSILLHSSEHEEMILTTPHHLDPESDTFYLNIVSGVILDTCEQVGFFYRGK